MLKLGTCESIIVHFYVFRHSKVQMRIAECLHYGLKNNIMVELLWKQCLEKPVGIANQKPIFSPSYQMHSEMLIKFLVHIPDHVANALKLKSRYFYVFIESIFLPFKGIYRFVQICFDFIQHVAVRLVMWFLLIGNTAAVFKLPLFYSK